MANIKSTNETITWLEQLHPPLSEDSIILRIHIIVLLIVIFIIGVTGNVASCVVILQNRSMRTVTNLYLLNLAASDLLMLSTIFLDVYFIWKPTSYAFGSIGCKFHFFSYLLPMNNGIMTILVLTVERYFAICHPFLLKARTKSRVIKVVIVIWLLSTAFAVFDCLEVNVKTSNDNIVLCVAIPSVSMRVTNGVLAILIFVIPMMIIVFVHATIAVKLNRKHKGNDLTFNKDFSRRKATKMLVVLTAAFFVCWFPHFAMRVVLFMSNYSNVEAIFGKILHGLFYLWMVNSWLSTAVNPIIFSIMSDKFKTAFKALLTKRKMKNQSRYINAKRTEHLESTFV